eukprot:gene25183-30230_t
MSEADVVSRLRSGMTIGIGGWGSRRKPMSLIREILKSELTDLTVVSYGGADVGLLCAAEKVRKVVFGFVSLDSIPLDPHFRAARQAGRIEVSEYDEGMLQWGLYAAGIPAESVYVSCEQVVPTAEFTADAHPSTIRIPRLLVSGVVHAPGGAHFTSCVPDYDRDEAFQLEYATAAKDPEAWQRFVDRYLSGSEADYQRLVAAEFEGVPVCAIACAEAYRGNGEVIASAFGVIPAIG